MDGQRTRRTGAGLLAALLVTVLLWWAQGGNIGTTDRPTSVPTSTASASTASDGLPTVAATDLPAEAQETLRLIAQGGPFAYDRDGVVFSNFEGLLPHQPTGYYHEYTVETPGSDDRGARRIVTGQDGQRYYTEDHYASFSRISG